MMTKRSFAELEAELTKTNERVEKLEDFRKAAGIARMLHGIKIQEFQDHYDECEKIIAKANERIAELEERLDRNEVALQLSVDGNVKADNARQAFEDKYEREYQKQKNLQSRIDAAVERSGITPGDTDLTAKGYWTREYLAEMVSDMLKILTNDEPGICKYCGKRQVLEATITRDPKNTTWICFGCAERPYPSTSDEPTGKEGE